MLLSCSLQRNCSTWSFVSCSPLYGTYEPPTRSQELELPPTSLFPSEFVQRILPLASRLSLFSCVGFDRAATTLDIERKPASRSWFACVCTVGGGVIYFPYCSDLQNVGEKVEKSFDCDDRRLHCWGRRGDICLADGIHQDPASAAVKDQGNQVALQRHDLWFDIHCANDRFLLTVPWSSANASWIRTQSWNPVWTKLGYQGQVT